MSPPRSRRPHVLFVQYTNPAYYPPLEHAGLTLLRSGWTVRYIGVESEHRNNELRFPPELQVQTRLVRYGRPGIFQKAHFLWFVARAVVTALATNPDWVYCSDLLSCPAGLLISYLVRCPLVYHEHDSPNWTPKRPGDLRGQFTRYLRRAREAVGRRADLVILPNRRRLELYAQDVGRLGPTVCVMNCPRREEASRRREARTTPRVRLVYHGSINPERLPMCLLGAIALLRGRVSLDVAGYESGGSRGYISRFLGEAGKLGLKDSVSYSGAFPTRELLLRHTAACDLGLALIPAISRDLNLENMTGASNKPFDYLACGIPVFVSGRADWRQMFVDPGYGLACDVAELRLTANTLKWISANLPFVEEMGERGRQRIIKEWNFEAQFEPVLAWMKQRSYL